METNGQLNAPAALATPLDEPQGQYGRCGEDSLFFLGCRAQSPVTILIELSLFQN
jgi:hypothetical protein